MKVRIIKSPTINAVKGAKTPPSSGRKQRFDEWYKKLQEFGYDGPQTPRDMQQWMVETPERKADVANWMRANPPVSQTNKGRKTYGDKKWEDYTNDEYLNAFTDDLFEYNNPVPSSKYNDIVNSDEFKAATPEQQQAILAEGNNYELKDGSFKKNDYKKQALPFTQAIPELTGFASALNTYNYQTPDYTHWEVNPNKLNIQPQLQSIDSSLNGVNATTTGNPQIDATRKIAAFTQGVNAKQQAFGNKQNYDSAQEFEAQKINMNARTQEQNLDVNAMNTIYNEYMPLAKDYAAGERIAAISSLSTKQALNEANENKKKMMLDNFYNNVEVGPDGKFKIKGDFNLSEDYYSTTTPAKETAVVTPSIVKSALADTSPSITRVDKVTTNQGGDDAIFQNAEMAPMKPSKNIYGYNLPQIPPSNYNKKKPSPIIVDDTTSMFIHGGKIRRK